MAKLDKKDLKKGWLWWQFWAMSTLSYEKLEANGFAHSMIPVAEKLYGKGTKEYAKCLERHSVFYNTEPQTGSIVNGIVASLEEKRSEGEEISDDMIHSVKSSLMGPIAGIGDSLVQGILIPILLSIAMSISASGNPLGVVFYIVCYLAIILSVSYWLYLKGYKLGLSAADLLVGENSNRLKKAFSILGTMVVGGLAASFVYLNTVIEFANESAGTTFNVQATLDSFFPGLLGLLSVLLCYYLINKKGWKSNKVLIFLIVLAAVGVLLGIF